MHITKKKNKGFTLMELLAVIAVLALIVGITLFVFSGNIKKAKENTYKVTISEIEKIASNYLIERGNELFYINDGVNSEFEYQCVSIQNLIDMGYFDNDIIGVVVDDNDNKIRKDDYVYVKRNIKTRVFELVKYVSSTDELNNTCSLVVRAKTDIRVNILNKDVWSKEKQVTISYVMNNLNDVNTVDRYEYEYKFNDIQDRGLMNLSGITKKFVIKDKGTLTANIYFDKEIIDSKEIPIDKIDLVNPSIQVDNESDMDASLEKIINVTITDDESGLKNGGILEYGFSDSNSVEPTYEKANLSYADGDKKTTFKITKTGLTGTYYLWLKVNISDMVGNNLVFDKVYGGYNFIYKFKVVIDKDSGISSVTGAGEYLVGATVTINASVNDYYKFAGFSGYKTSSDSSYTFTMPAQDVTFKANSKAYTCSKGTLTKHSSKGYICVADRNKGGYYYDCSYQCGQTCHYTGGYCCDPSKCGNNTGGQSCCSRCTECEPKICEQQCWHTTYYCPSGWSTYSGSGSNLKCYIAATLK